MLGRVVLRGQRAARLDVRADIDRGRGKWPVHRAGKQAQRHGQVGIVFQCQLAGFHCTTQAVGKAEHLQSGKATFGPADCAGGGQQVQLLGVAMKNSVQLLAVLAQQFAAKHDGVGTHRQRRAAGVLHAVPGMAAHRLGQRNQFMSGHGLLCRRSGGQSGQRQQVGAQPGQRLTIGRNAQQLAVVIEQEHPGAVV